MQQQQARVGQGTVAELDLAARGPVLEGHEMETLNTRTQPKTRGARLRDLELVGGMVKM